MFRITFSKSHVKRFQQESEKAYERGNKRMIRHLEVLLMIGCNVAMETKSDRKATMDIVQSIGGMVLAHF
jgi:hypothetical protein